MKQTKHILLTAVMLLCSLAASAHDFEVDGIYYNILSAADRTVEVTVSNIKYSGDIIIPSTVVYEENIYNVISIGFKAFESCENLVSVLIPQSVKSIGKGAFMYCDNLMSIEVPNGVEVLDYGVFMGCSNLKTIVVPKSVIFIEENAFEYTAWYEEQPDGPVYIGNVLYAYKGVMPENSSFSIKEGTTGITGSAFRNCVELTSITIPESVSFMGKDVFSEESSWYKHQPEGSIYLGKVLYKYKGEFSNEASIKVKDGTTAIAGGAFEGCANLKKIILPETIISLGERSFSDCGGLVSINIPQNVEWISYWAFENCSNLETITVDEANKKYDSRNNCNAIIETMNNKLVAGCSTTIFPSELQSIGVGAFIGRNNLTSIVIPTGVDVIETSAFASCKNLTVITIPESVHYVDWYAFAWCDKLSDVYVENIEAWCSIIFPGGHDLFTAENVYLDGEPIKELIIPNTVTSIEHFAFNSSEFFSSIVIEESITSIGHSAFSYCKRITSLVCKAITPPTLASSSTFYGVDKSIPVYVPASSVAAYQSAPFWNEFTNIQPITKEFTLTVSSAGYATMYLDYAVEIPKNAEVYIATSVEDDRLKMTRVIGVLPANTGVIVRAKEGTYTFVESTATPANVEGNLLSGTAEATYITAESGHRYYVLAQKDGVVGMYRPMLTEGRFLNNANKSYLALKTDDLGIFDDETNTEEEDGQLSNRLRFDFGGTTGVEQTIVNGQQTTVIYDLQGRKVADAEGLKGIYIVNGRKVIFK